MFPPLAVSAALQPPLSTVVQVRVTVPAAFVMVNVLASAPRDVTVTA
jgi:hypothetical protein